MEQTTIELTTLQMKRSYNAPRELVFKALTDPDLLARWFAPTDDFTCVVDRFEARIGGSYRIEMRHKGGSVHTAIGRIEDIQPPSKLSYTWRWEGGEMPDTLVTWMLEETDGGTELTLVHDRFPNEEARAQHVTGWNGCLGRLQQLFGRAAMRYLEFGLAVNERLFRNALEGVSDDHFAARLNDRTNSMQWVAGHLAHSRMQMARLVDADVDVHMSVFGESIDTSADYPSREEIVRAFETASDALRARLQDVHEIELALPAPMQFPVNDSTIGGAIAFFAEHEGYHIGQLGFLRKAHGYDAVSYA